MRVISRRGIDHTDQAPAIAEALLALNVRSATLDGEGVICDPNGVTDFDRLRAAMGRKGSRQGFLYAFDLLELDGQDLRQEPWEARRATLVSLLRKVADGLRLVQPMARRCCTTPAAWVLKASSPSGATAATVGTFARLDQGQEHGASGNRAGDVDPVEQAIIEALKRAASPASAGGGPQLRRLLL